MTVLTKQGFQSYLRNNRQLSRYSDPLRAGRSEVQNPVENKYFARFQTDPEVNPAACAMGTGC